MTRGRWDLTPLEVACGFPIGLEPPPPELPEIKRGAAPIAALEQALLPALTRSPCVVSFSGGRDSSAVLAVATEVARREGLPPPIPVTLRFPRAPDAQESDWQERVVHHLGVDDWVRIDFDDELDLLGPIAASLLRRHGLVWPPNSHFHVPILDHARGGSIVTGIDGDGLFATWRWGRVAAVLERQVRPVPRDALRLGLALSPRPIRRLHAIHQRAPSLPWLKPSAPPLVARAWAEAVATEPHRWDRWVSWWARLRSLRMVLRTFELMAGDADVRAVHPLADPLFLVALAQHGGQRGLGNRTAIMRALFGHVLPDDVLARRSKSHFNTPFFNRHSRSFVTTWTGEGVDHDLVDIEALRKEWSNEMPHAASSTLLQAAWLTSAAAGPERS